MDVSMSDQHASNLTTQLSQELYTRHSLTVSPDWMKDFLTTVRNPPPPLPALTSTAKFRVLHGDLTHVLRPHSHSTNRQRLQLLLPQNIADVNVQQLQLQTNVPVQILDMFDVGSSKWSQIEAIERFERGEEIRGREVIRSIPSIDDDGGNVSSGVVDVRGNGATGQGSTAKKHSAGPHKVLLQDAAGTKVWGFEITTIPRLFITNTIEDGGLQIGAKVLLTKGTMVRRGMVMLEPQNTTVMGGKVEEWDKKWRATRKQRLVDDLKRENEQ